MRADFACKPWTALLALAFLTQSVHAQSERVGPDSNELLTGRGDQVIRTVGGVDLRASDVFQLLELAAPGQVAEAVDELVLMTLVRLEARREGVDVPTADLEREVDRTLAEQRARFAVEVRSDVTLDEYVAQRHGWDADAFKTVVRKGVLGNMLMDRAVRLNTYRGSRDELQILLVEDEDLAQEVSAKVQEGASFSVLAKNHSVHPSGPEGGFMPPLPLEVELPLVAGRASLKPGEVLGPAPITLGGKDYWRMIRLVGRRTGDARSWPELSAQVEQDLLDRPIHPDELALFEAAMADRYLVTGPGSAP